MKLPDLSQEPIIYVDATPDKDYPLRILRAYRENCKCEWMIESVDEGLKFLTDKMNKNNRKRAVILDAAIAILERGNDEESCSNSRT